MAALSRFLPKSAEKGSPFFKLHKKSRSFVWNEECEKAFQSFREYQSKDTQLARYFHKVSNVVQAFDEFVIEHIPREENARADLLSNLAS